jgi:hypothetical protein
MSALRHHALIALADDKQVHALCPCLMSLLMSMMTRDGSRRATGFHGP